MRKAFKEIAKEELKSKGIKNVKITNEVFKNNKEHVYVEVKDYCESVIVRNILKPLIKEVNSKNPYEYLVHVYIDYTDNPKGFEMINVHED